MRYSGMLDRMNNGHNLFTASQESRSYFTNLDCSGISNAGILVGVPILAGFILSRLIADPVFYVVEQRVPLAFAPTDAQKVSSHGTPVTL